MKRTLIAGAILLAACAGVTAAQAPAPVRKVETRIKNAQGDNIGFATFREGPRGVVILLEFHPRALKAGWHGAHLHQKGDCTDFAAGFQASGAHMGHTPGAGRHGLLNPAGPEVGDLPNIFVADTDGPFAAELYADGVTLLATSAGGRVPLRGPQGSALIVHENADDHISQPIGGAGARVACVALRP